jgi:pimeloyl-ACP methyl ester carboxylesterase
MANYVLVGGAWMGGWAWGHTAQELRRQGHEVFAATLTGLGERAHLASPAVDLEVHITDVVNLLAFEDLRDVVLVGHSYSGIVISGVADKAGDRLSHLVFCDSAPFLDGESYLSVGGDEARAAAQRTAAEHGDGWRLPLPPFEELGRGSSLRGLDAAALDLFRSRAVPQPLRTYTQALRLRGDPQPRYERVAIACDNLRQLIGLGIPRMREMTERPWRYVDLDTGHWPMLSAPAELARVLAEVNGR